MTCPKCEQSPMPLVQFMLANGPVKTRCIHCQSALKGDSFIKASYYLTLLIAILFGLRVYGFQQQGLMTVLEMMGILTLFISLTLALKGWLSWKFGRYLRDWDAEA